MSGQQIGAAVGFVVGAYFGYPQLGAAIGGYIGGAIDPTEIKGPHIGDGQNQSSQEGVPIPWVLGTYGWIQGNIVQKSKRREVKKKDDGKGSGTVAINYEAHQDFCIMVCESSEIRNSTVVAPLIVRVNGKIVYDMRPDKNFAAENSKFLQHHTFYVGNENQFPDPTMEAITGVGNTPAYRGVFTCVCRDINLAPYGDAIPTYEWVMVGEGEEITVSEEYYSSPALSEFVDADFPLKDAEAEYTLVGLRSSNRYGSYSNITGDTIQSIIDQTPLYGDVAKKFLGWSVVRTDLRYMFDATDPVNDETVILVYNNDVESIGIEDQHPYGNGANCSTLASDGLWRTGSGGELFTRFAGGGIGVYDLFQDCLPNADVCGMFPLYIYATRKRKNPTNRTGDPCLLAQPVILPDDSGQVIDCDGNIQAAPDYEMASGSFLALQREEFTIIDGRHVFTQYTIEPVIANSSDQNNRGFWESAYNDAVAQGKLPSGLVYPTDYPKGISSAYKASYTNTTLISDQIQVSTSIERICIRGGLRLQDINTDKVDQTLSGYCVANTYDGADSIRSLLTAYGLYAAEYQNSLALSGGQLVFDKLGEDIDVLVDPGEMIEGQTQTDQSEREQAIEYPRSILLSYIDPTQDYAVRPQPWRRLTPDVRAIGEETMQVAVVMLPDDAARTVDTYGKRAWARAQGSRKFSLPFAGTSEVYLRLHPGKSFALDSKRYVIDTINIEDGELAIEASYDRQSAYTSNVTAIPALPPTPPVSTIGGVTLFAGMNLPRLRSQDNSPGIYVAVAGLLETWPGCLLQMSINDGASWTTAIASMTQESVIGYLTENARADPDEVFKVSVHGGELDSISDVEISANGNPSVILSNEIPEVFQFKTATQTGDHSYDLSDLYRAQLGTGLVSHNAGDRFVLLTDVYFLPLDISLAGKTLLFRPVTLGAVPENNGTYAVTFNPQFIGPQLIENYTDHSGEVYTDSMGNPYFKVIN